MKPGFIELHHLFQKRKNAHNVKQSRYRRSYTYMIASKTVVKKCETVFISQGVGYRHYGLTPVPSRITGTFKRRPIIENAKTTNGCDVCSVPWGVCDPKDGIPKITQFFGYFMSSDVVPRSHRSRPWSQTCYLPLNVFVLSAVSMIRRPKES